MREFLLLNVFERFHQSAPVLPGRYGVVVARARSSCGKLDRLRTEAPSSLMFQACDREPQAHGDQSGLREAVRLWTAVRASASSDESRVIVNRVRLDCFFIAQLRHRHL